MVLIETTGDGNHQPKKGCRPLIKATGIPHLQVRWLLHPGRFRN